MKAILISIAAVVAILFAASTQVTLFIIPPIGIAPEGRTLVISRLANSRFIDSADAMCDRLMGRVNLLCRGMMLGRVGEVSEIYFRLPYSETLYLMSADGRRY